MSNADLGVPLSASTPAHQTLQAAITPPAQTRPTEIATTESSATRGSTAQPLPPAYRGKSSGEFQRVTTHVAPDANQLIVEAENKLAQLPISDRNRRLLEVAILRRDTALLNGILESLRRR